MIRVVLADDSPFLRHVLKDILKAHPAIEVVGEGENGKEAVELVAEKRPDVLILDCQMPVMDGLEALQKIMKENPLPVVMFSVLTVEGAEVTIKALEYGAVDFVTKPASGFLSLDEVAEELQLKVVAIGSKSSLKKEKAACGVRSSLPLKTAGKKPVIIAIGSSTGGVKAAMDIFPKIVKKTPPIVWVQHMPAVFTSSLAERLNSISDIEIREARPHDKLKQGVCLLAPGGQHMRVVKQALNYVVEMKEPDYIAGPKPSCDFLFSSVADFFYNNALGVIMTGMGTDGALGLKKMHDRGAFVIGQDERSSVVYGMAKAACRNGAVDIEMPLAEIAPKINKLITAE